MTIRHSSTSARRAPRGQMIAIFALTLGVFVGALALGIDLSRLRTEAERVQHAANAAALAGVVFLPDYQTTAYYRAREEAVKNSFHDGQSGVTVTPMVEPGYSTRLRVTVTEPSPLIFGKALGLGPQTISRSAVAEYAQPLQMGAPDYVLGYPPFPTNLITPTAGITPTQGFYLEARGPYGQQENGDAYSQFYESFNGVGFKGDSTDTNPCPSSTVLGGCSNLTLNPDNVRIGEGSSGFAGYDYVVDNPITQTLVIKIFDPYDEGAYNQDDTSTKACCTAPQNQHILTPYGTKFPDQWSCVQGGTQWCAPGTNTPTTVSTQFTLSGPYNTLYDNTPKTIAITPTMSTAPGSLNTGTCSSDCVISNPYIAGDDPIHTLCQPLPATGANPRKTCYDTHPNPYAYKFLNYAIIHAKGLYHIHVQTVINAGGIYNGKYGTGGNIFALAACADTSPVLGSPNLPAGDNNGATADPYIGTGSTPGWNPLSCPDPNTAIAGCAHPGTAPVDQCVHIFAVGRMCLYNNLAPAGSTAHAYAIVPLGYVPTDYAGQTLQVHLYDVGDINGSNTNGVEVLTPAGDTTHFDSTTNAGFPSSLPYSWSVAPTDSNSSYVTKSTSSVITPQEIGGLAGWTHKYNGSWLKINTTIPSNDISPTYTQMVSQFGGYWKMLYDIGPGDSGNDTTTWEISVNGSPVHLVTN